MRRVHYSGRRRSSMTDRRVTDRTAQALAGRLAAVEQLVVEQQERLAQQELELASLRATVSATPAEQGLILSAAAREPQPNHVGLPRSSRRALLKMGGAAAAASVA